MKFTFRHLATCLALAVSLSSMAQLLRSDAFNAQYQLKEVVVLSRHNIRAPLSTNGSKLGKLTSHQWIDWSAAASELTLRGGVLETQMGQFFRKWTVSEGLFTENYFPTTDEVNVYANSMQRTIATAEYFAGGFMPVANLSVYHRFSPSKMDPIFFPRLTKVTPDFIQQAKKQIAAMGGKKGMEGLNEELLPAYEVLESTLDLAHSPMAKEGFAHFGDYPTELTFVLGKEPNMKGGLKLATSASDALILQYYEAPTAQRAAFGRTLSNDDWTKIAQIKDVYGDVLFAAPIVAVNVAHPLLEYIHQELNADKRKFTFLCGHDSNIASVNAALEVVPFTIPNAIEKKTPIGSKVVFEKWTNQAGEVFVSINLVYQNVEQLRHTTMLDLHTRPEVVGLQLKGIQPNKDGLYTMEQVNERFLKAIRAYEAI